MSDGMHSCVFVVTCRQEGRGVGKGARRKRCTEKLKPNLSFVDNVIFDHCIANLHHRRDIDLQLVHHNEKLEKEKDYAVLASKQKTEWLATMSHEIRT